MWLITQFLIVKHLKKNASPPTTYPPGIGDCSRRSEFSVSTPKTRGAATVDGWLPPSFFWKRDLEWLPILSAVLYIYNYTHISYIIWRYVFQIILLNYICMWMHILYKRVLKPWDQGAPAAAAETFTTERPTHEKSYTRIKVNYGNRSPMEKASWRAGKMAIMYDFVHISNHKIWVKPTFCIAGANQDATSTRRCDLSQDPSKGILGKAWWTGPKFEQNRPAPYRESLTSLWLKRCHWSTLQGLVSFGTVAR